MYISMNINMISNLKDTTDDEHITIRPSLVKTVDEDVYMEYNVIHRIPSCMIKTHVDRVIRMTLRSMKDLITYVDSLLNLLHADESPYASIQFDLPMMPSVIVSPKNLTYSIRNIIATHLTSLSDDWPVVPLPPSRRNSVAWTCNSSNENPSCESKNPKLNKHIFFNDDNTAYHSEYFL
jgi:hypothetical protein